MDALLSQLTGRFQQLVWGLTVGNCFACGELGNFSSLPINDNLWQEESPWAYGFITHHACVCDSCRSHLLYTRHGPNVFCSFSHLKQGHLPMNPWPVSRIQLDPSTYTLSLCPTGHCLCPPATCRHLPPFSYSTENNNGACDNLQSVV
jgi:hypothetical protein